ncbi:SET domain containing protein [Babesia divergens]|uniref:SET domain containing protein n=1 Tax=Babesia divergens TaxID=32595 RepID=A0AAD9LEY9_BABDI|nr:SET domain containing protein [Babesia divergens]
MTRMKVEKSRSVIARVRAAIADSVPAEFMPLKEDIESYLISSGLDPKLVEQVLVKFPELLSDGPESDLILEPKSRRPYTRRKKLPQVVDEDDATPANSDIMLSQDDEISNVTESDVLSHGVIPRGNDTGLSQDSDGFVIPSLPTGFTTLSAAEKQCDIPESEVSSVFQDPTSIGAIAAELPCPSGATDSVATEGVSGKLNAPTSTADVPDSPKGTRGKKRGSGRPRSRHSSRDTNDVGSKDTHDTRKPRVYESHKSGKKLVWPLFCWICREPMNRCKSYVVCTSICKRAFHVNCEGLKSSKLRFPLKPEEVGCHTVAAVEGAKSDVGVSGSIETSSGLYNNTLISNTMVNTDELDRASKVTSAGAGDHVVNDTVSQDSVDVSETGRNSNMLSTSEPTTTGCEESARSFTDCTNLAQDAATAIPSSTGSTRITPNCVARECSFCLNSYSACSNCHKFVPLKQLARCAVKGCTSFYCYPHCLGRVRLVVPDRSVIDIHNAVYGNAARLLDDCNRPIFICHAHTCWSCYDCNRYSYVWESIWRVEAYRNPDDYMAKAWRNLRSSCRGKVETSHFAKGKRIPRPPTYPDMRCYKSFLQYRRLNLYGCLNSGNMESLYPLSDDEERATFHKVTTNVLLRCIRCDRTWCTSCLHPDVHVLPHSAKQIVCQDCIHLQVAQCVTFTSTALNNQRNMAQREIFEPRLEIESNHPQSVFRQIAAYLDEQHSMRSKIAMAPTFLDQELFIPEPDLPMAPPPRRKFTRAASQHQDLSPATGKRRVFKGAKRNVYNTNTLLQRHQNIKTIAKQRVDNMRSKEFSMMVKDCDEFTILRLCNDFRYQSSNIITDDSLRTIAGPTTSQRCTCVRVCDQQCANVMRHTECNNSNCAFMGRDCGNRRFKHLGMPKLRLQHLDGKGVGAFATDTIERNELVCEYVGELITQAEFQRCVGSWSFAELDNENRGHWYIMKVHKDAYIDSTNVGNVARFINHSCDPNCSSIPYSVNGAFRMGVFALRRIEKGEEVTYNYGFTSRGVGVGFKCLCGSKNCRGIVGVQPDMSSESLAMIESLKHAGSEIDTLSQLTCDMMSLYISKDDNCMKQRPSPIDILNGMLTAGDLYRHEQLQNRLKLTAESRIAPDLSLPINPIGAVLADNIYVNQSLLNYVKMLVLGGRTIKEWDMANTKEFAATIPWGIIALENNKISKSRALESSCAFPDFYERGKRFIQTVCMVSSRQSAGDKGSENLQEVLDLTWGSTEPCFACGGYGDCKYCDHCGDVLHDDNACGDFYVTQEGLSLCSVCQNSDHRYEWLTARDIDRERMAMQLWGLRMERSYIQSRETFRSLLLQKRPSHVTDAESKEQQPQIYLRPETLLCPQKDLERFSKSPLTFYDRQVKYQSLCQTAIKNYTCFW